MPTQDAFPDDPRALSLAARRAECQRRQADNQRWLDRLRALAEPQPAADFPAFLLATPPFADLARRLGGAARRRDLPTGLADELDRFVEAYRAYLRTCSGEDAFLPGRRAG